MIIFMIIENQLKMIIIGRILFKRFIRSIPFSFFINKSWEINYK